MRKVLIIAGPTGIGKSALAEKIALSLNLPVVSADSRQLFKETTIGVGKPAQEVLSKIQYHEINTCSIHEENDVVKYLFRVKSILNKYQGNIIIVGGTGFYIKALLEGIDILPSKNTILRQNLEHLLAQNGLEALQKKYLQIENPFLKVDINNPQRLIRAIEIGSQSHVKRMESPLAGAETTIMGLFMDREKLYDRINHRVDKMLHDGLVNEAKKLWPFETNINLKTVGYAELFEHFNGEYTLETAIENIKKNTRNYAKRQMTYFKNQLNMEWINACDTEKIDAFVLQFSL